MPLSTTRPSSWLNMGECVASLSERNTLPGTSTFIGGFSLSMVRICPGEVWVRSSRSSVSQNVSCISREG